MTTGVYKIKNKLNERIYIGSSLNIERRWVRHKYELRHNIHTNKFLQNDWNKCGESNFEFLILEDLSKEDIRIVEQEYLNKYFDKDNCYNLSPHVEIDKGIFLSKELKRKLSNSLKEVWKKPEHREKMKLAMKETPFRNNILNSEKMKKLWQNENYVNSVKNGLKNYQKTAKAKLCAKLAGERLVGNKNTARKIENIIFIDPNKNEYIPQKDLYTFCKIHNLKYPTVYSVVFGVYSSKLKHQFKNGWIMIRL